MRLADRKIDYGWISIFLHWIVGIIVMVMLVVGSRLVAAEGAGRESLLNLHTTIGIIAYPLLWGRIVWRGLMGHPGPLPSQSRGLHAIGRATHYVLLIGMAIMLLSGPVTAWSSGHAITVFDHVVAARGEFDDGLFVQASQVHHGVGLAMLLLVLLHIAAAIKHMAFDRDGTVEKIMIPGARPLKPAEVSDPASDIDLD